MYYVKYKYNLIINKGLKLENFINPYLYTRLYEIISKIDGKLKLKK